MSNRLESFLLRAVNIAIERSNHPEHRIACLLIRGGKIISTGWNANHQHGEHSALNRVWENGADGAVAFVVRVRRDGTIGMAHPCDLCMQRLKEAGVRKVIYTNQEGQLETIKLSSEPVELKPNQMLYHFTTPNHNPKIINRRTRK